MVSLLVTMQTWREGERETRKEGERGKEEKKGDGEREKERVKRGGSERESPTCRCNRFMQIKQQQRY